MASFGGWLHRLEEIAAPVLRPIMRGWGRIPVEHQGKILTALPIVAVVLSAGVALIGNSQRERTEVALQRHITLSHTVADVLALMVNAETGLRGYLLTRQDAFLEPYDLARRDLPSALSDLHDIAASEPGAAPRARKLAAIDHVTELSLEQMADLEWQRGYVAGDDPDGDQILHHLARGKQIMDAIRDDVATLQTEEEALLLDRLQEINAIRARDYSAIFITLLVGLASRGVGWYLFNRGVTRRIELLTEHVRARRQGNNSAYTPSEKHDAIGHLEREIAASETVWLPLPGDAPTAPTQPARPGHTPAQTIAPHPPSRKT